MDFLSKIEFLDRLIRQQSTGSVADLAKGLKTSKRSVFNYLKWMKQHGAPIAYSKKLRSYYYKTPVAFVVTFMKVDV